jgi:DNA-binding GntR family transcriptional regulator
LYYNMPIVSSRASSTSDATSRPLEVVSVRDALRHALRAQILSGAQAPGTKITEEEVARRYEVARPTARQVIQDLVFEGLLRRRPNHSAEVPILTAGDVREIYAIRTLIETVAIRRLTERRQVPDEMVVRVRALEAISDADVAASDEGWASVVEHDQTFHAALVETLGNQRLARMYASVQGENRLCLAQERYAYASVADVAREHRALLRAIGDASPERAAELLCRHLHEACERLVAIAGDGRAEPVPDARA